MEQLIILILVFALPALIRRLTQNAQKRSGAPPPARRAGQAARPAAPGRPIRQAPAPVPDEALDDEVQELPDWLRELSTQLGGRIEKAQPETPVEDLDTGGGITEVREVSPMEDESSGWRMPERPERIVPDEDRQAAMTTRAYLKETPTRTRISHGHELSKPSRSRTWPDRSVFVPPANRAEWRRAVILQEILGAPRAVSPWRGVASDEG